MEKYYIKELHASDNYIFFDSLTEDIKENFKDDIFVLFERSGINNEPVNIIKNMLDASDYDLQYSYKNNIASYVIDCISSIKRINVKTALKIAHIVKHQDNSKAQNVCDILSVLFNGNYVYRTLRGYSQSDWAHMFYNMDRIGFDFVEYIEAVIFNTGTEILIHDEESEPQNADDICGYCEYIVNNRTTLKQCISEQLSIPADKIVLYSIKDVRTVIKIDYKIEE